VAMALPTCRLDCAIIGKKTLPAQQVKLGDLATDMRCQSHQQLVTPSSPTASLTGVALSQTRSGIASCTTFMVQAACLI